MKRLLSLFAFACLWLAPAHAQTTSAYVVAACGGSSFAVGQSFPLQMTQAGLLCTNSSGGGGGGGTSSTFGAAFPTTGTAIGLSDGTNMVPWKATTNYGTAPAAIPVPAANVDVTNANSNGQATAANSSPVVLPAAQITLDPCTLGTKTNFTISTTSGTLQLVAPSGTAQVYVCSLFTVGATASIQNIVGGTGATCTTGTPVALAGSTTAANGMSFAANGGFTFGNGGGTILRTTTAGHGVCLIQSATAQISGGGTYVQQ